MRTNGMISANVIPTAIEAPQPFRSRTGFGYPQQRFEKSFLTGGSGGWPNNFYQRTGLFLQRSALFARPDIGNDAGSALLHKEGTAFALHMPMHDGISAEAEIKLAEGIAEGLSADVFAGSPVEVLLCDRQLATLKVVKSR
jgi:hypothetical protein